MERGGSGRGKDFVLSFPALGLSKNLQVLLDVKVTLDPCRLRSPVHAHGRESAGRSKPASRGPAPPPPPGTVEARGRNEATLVSSSSHCCCSHHLPLPFSPDTTALTLLGLAGQQPEQEGDLWSNKIQRPQFNTNPPCHYINF